MVKIAFVGNPNAGKSTWINYLANAHLKVANYAGVSVEEQSTHMIYKNETLSFIDLPGIYDLDVASAEENYTKNYLDKHEVDLIVNVIDARDLKRGLHLTAQLKKMKLPLMVLLNYVDKVEEQEVKALSERIKTPIMHSAFQHKELVLDTFLELKGQPSVSTFNEKVVYQLHNLGVRKHYEGDALLLHPYLGIPLLFILLVTSITFIYLLATPLSEGISALFEQVNSAYIMRLNTIIIVDTMIQSIWFTLTSIASFLPFLFGIFLLITFLEESGYIARIAYLLDGFMHMFHLSGKSVIPLLVGFGCNVPAIMATRTIPNRKERVACALMIPFISCSAKLPIFLLFIHIFFKDMQLSVLFILYGLSILVSLFVGAFFSLKQGKEEIFMMELPSYALPKGKVLWQRATLEVKHFLKKVSKVMIISMLLLTFIFPFFQSTAYQKLFAPLGFSESVEAVESIPFGFISKENLVVYYAQKKGTQDLDGFLSSLWQEPNVRLKALCYLLYLSMSIPCVMTLAALRSEFGNRVLLVSIVIMLIVPYLMSLFAYQTLVFLQTFL